MAVSLPSHSFVIFQGCSRGDGPRPPGAVDLDNMDTSIHLDDYNSLDRLTFVTKF